MPDANLVLDWGTTNLRAWVLDETGRPVRHKAFPLGIGRLEAGEAQARFFDTIRPQMAAEGLPTLMCGMVGSKMGWELAPYLDCPADLAALRGAFHAVASDGAPVRIIPGLRSQRPDGGPDVLRGEETQLIGWLAADPAHAVGERLVLQPGTHAKWVRMLGGRVESFVSSMTGELFDVLCKNGVLRGPKGEDSPEAFALGLEAAGDGGALASRIFTARSRVVGGDLPPEHAHAYLSGVLIGAEIASVPALFGVSPGVTVSIIGDPRLCARYEQALTARGFGVAFFDGDAAVLAGLAALAA